MGGTMPHGLSPLVGEMAGRPEGVFPTFLVVQTKKAGAEAGL